VSKTLQTAYDSSAVNVRPGLGTEPVEMLTVELFCLHLPLHTDQSCSLGDRATTSQLNDRMPRGKSLECCRCFAGSDEAGRRLFSESCVDAARDSTLLAEFSLTDFYPQARCGKLRTWFRYCRRNVRGRLRDMPVNWLKTAQLITAVCMMKSRRRKLNDSDVRISNAMFCIY
jgi:hypothetical protein